MPPYYGSHERIHNAEWELYSDFQYLELTHFLTPNVYQEHGYDDDILDIAWNNIEAMRKRQNKYTGIYEIGLIGRCGNVYMFMISHPIDEYTVKVFHMMPLTLEDAEELDFYPGAWYDYPTSLTLSSDDMEEEW